MLAAAAVALPVAWIYTLTRSKRGYQQSVVQLLIILPVVVAGILVMVKYSLTLAFSLAGIAAAVRFRNSLDDSKDAVYVFLVTGIGMAAGLKESTEGLGAVGGYKDLAKYTTLGGSLFVFSLPGGETTRTASN